MNQIIMNKEILKMCIDTASICFFNYPLNDYLYNGIENAHSFYRSQSLITLKKASRRKELFILDPELKGTGAFRKLIEPLLKQADNENKPVILETHNPELISLYSHFGFELVKTLSSDHIELKQYCMIRYPKQTT